MLNSLNIKLFNFQGAEVYFNLLFLLLFLLMPWHYVVILFISVLIHEMSHVWMAVKKFYPVYSINIDIMGGLATTKNINIKDQPIISLIGPFSNLVLFMTTYVLNLLYPHYFLEAFFGINIILFIFNILPIYPMDGGMALRSWMLYNCRKIGITQPKANLYSVIISIICSVLLVIFSLVYGYLILALLCCYFIYISNKMIPR